MKTQRIYILFILVCTLFGSTFLSISLGLRAGASPLFFAALRFTLAGGLLLAGLGLSGRLNPGRLRALSGRAVVFALFNTVGTFGFMFVAQTRVDSGLMARLDATGPIVTALLAALFLGKRFGVSHFAAFVLGTSGCILIAAPATGSADGLYLTFAAASVVLYGTANVLYPLLFSNGDDPVVISALQALAGGIILMAAAAVWEPVRFPVAAVWPLAYLVVGGSIIGHTAALVLIRDAGPVFASGWLYVAPVVATALGALVLGEPVTVTGIFGTGLALTGVFALGRAEKKTERPAHREAWTSPGE